MRRVCVCGQGRRVLWGRVCGDRRDGVRVCVEGG